MSQIADELEKLHDLKVRGVLSESEFHQQKARLLAGNSPPPPRPAQVSHVVHTNAAQAPQGGSGFAVGSLVMGIVSMLAVMGGSEDPDFGAEDGWLGVLMFAGVGIGLSVVAFSGLRTGRGMAFVGLGLSILAGLAAIGNM